MVTVWWRIKFQGESQSVSTIAYLPVGHVEWWGPGGFELKMDWLSPIVLRCLYNLQTLLINWHLSGLHWVDVAELRLEFANLGSCCFLFLIDYPGGSESWSFTLLFINKHYIFSLSLVFYTFSSLITLAFPLIPCLELKTLSWLCKLTLHNFFYFTK